MKEPFFSIVVPTRNRPDLLKECISSVLLQDFDDFELIISDDSDNEENTEFLTQLQRKDPRVVNIRPEAGKIMQDHFEWATRHSTGHYTLLFPDRSILIQGALRKMYEAISKNPGTQVVFWPWLVFDEKRKIFYGRSIVDKGYVNRRSEEIIHNFLRNPEDLYNLPRNLNSCYSQEISKKIRSKFGRLFMILNPDFTFCFLTLSQTDKFLYLKEPFFISQGLTKSMGNKLATSWVNNISEEEMFKMVPLKAPLYINTLFEDFLKIQQLADGNLFGFKISYPSYISSYYKELFYKKHLFEREKFKSYLIELENFRKTMSREDQKELKNKMRFFWLSKIKFLIERSFLDNYAKSVKRRIESLRIKGVRRKNANVLQAAGFDDLRHNPK